MEENSQYLPKQLSDNDTKKLCSEIISSTGASSIKDMGKVMAKLKAELHGNADMSLVSEITKKNL